MTFMRRESVRGNVSAIVKVCQGDDASCYKTIRMRGTELRIPTLLPENAAAWVVNNWKELRLCGKPHPYS